MPLYRNPDFQRPPSGLARAFDKSPPDSFFALPAWYDLIARYGVPQGTEIRAYTYERPASAAALLAQTRTENDGRKLTSLTNAHSLEHDILHAPGADLQTGLAAILSEMIAERPQWDCFSLSELDPREPSYAALVGALGRAGLLVERSFLRHLVRRDGGPELSRLSRRPPFRVAQYVAPQAPQSRAQQPFDEILCR
jgi:hypothetical protein